MKDRMIKFGYLAGGIVLGGMIGVLGCKKYYMNKASLAIREMREFYDEKLELLNLVSKDLRSTDGQGQIDTENVKNNIKMLQKSVTNEVDGEKNQPNEYFEKLVSEIDPEEMHDYGENHVRKSYDTYSRSKEDDSKIWTSLKGKWLRQNTLMTMEFQGFSP